MMVLVDSNENTWNYFSATETIERPATVNDAGLATPATNTVLSVTRRLGSGNVWTQSNSYQPIQPIDSVRTASPDSVNTGAFTASDAGTQVTLTTASGATIAPLDYWPNVYGVDSPPPGQNAVTAFPAPPSGWSGDVSRGATGALLGRSGQMGVALRSSTPNPSANPRAWIGNFVVTPASRVTIEAARARRFGPKIGTVGDLDRYVTARDSVTVEELVDPKIGATVERNVVVNGKLRSHVTKSYGPIGGDRYVLMNSRTEVASRRGAPRTTLITFTELHVERRDP